MRTPLAAIQQLLNYFNDGDILITDDMIATALGEMKPESQDLSQAKQIEIEKGLIESEFKEISAAIQESQETYEARIQALLNEELQLLENCSDEEERERIMRQYEMQRNSLKDKMAREKEEQLRLVKIQVGLY